MTTESVSSQLESCKLQIYDAPASVQFALLYYRLLTSGMHISENLLMLISTTTKVVVSYKSHFGFRWIIEFLTQIKVSRRDAYHHRQL